MAAIPPFVLKKLYVKGSLRLEETGFALDITNPIAPGTILGLTGLELDGKQIAADQVTIITADGESRPAVGIGSDTPLSFPLGATFTLQVVHSTPETGPHKLTISVLVQDVGPLNIPVSDDIA